MEKLMNLAIGLMQAGTERPNGKKSTEELGETSSFKDMLQQKTDESVEKPTDEQDVVENPELQETEEVKFDDQTLENAKAMLATQMFPMNIVVVDAEETQVLVETAEIVAPVVTEVPQEIVLPEEEMQLPQMAETDSAEVSVELPQTQTTEVVDMVNAPEILEEQPAVEVQTIQQPVDNVSESEPVTVTVEDQGSQVSENPEQVLETTEQTVEERPEEAIFSQTDTIPIKVAEPEAPAQTAEAESVGAQIEEKLTSALDQGETKVVVQLTPENLGKVTVELARTEEGMVHVVLKAESAHTQSLLERHVSNIQNALAGNGHSDVQVEIERRQEPQNEQRQDLNDQQKNQEHNQRQQERKRRSQNSEDFLHQLRLGLVPTESIS